MPIIIVGADLSTESERAVAHAVGVARHVGAQLMLVLVDVEAHRGELGALRERWTGHGVELSQLVVDGYPDERLPGVAAELGAELIVVGSHGRTGLKRFLIGSVAEQVIRRADQSVLVARGDAPDGGYRRVVIGTDFSAPAEHAIARALPLIARGGRIDLVHCWQPPWAGTFGELVQYDELHAGLDQSLREAGNRLRTLARDRPDLEVVSDLVPAPPAHGLVSVAEARTAELIVVGSHGRRGVRRLLLGSVAAVTARHAACSVLIAR